MFKYIFIDVYSSTEQNIVTIKLKQKHMTKAKYSLKVIYDVLISNVVT